MSEERTLTKIEYPSVLLLHLNRILQRINEKGVDPTTELSVDAFWFAIPQEWKKDGIEENYNKIDEEYKQKEKEAKEARIRNVYGRTRVFLKLQMIINLLARNNILYRSTYEEFLEDDIIVGEVE